MKPEQLNAATAGPWRAGVKLQAEVNAILSEAQRTRPRELEHATINWEDLKCSGVYLVQDLLDGGSEFFYMVEIDEANSPELEEYVKNALGERGCPGVKVNTEW